MKMEKVVYPVLAAVVEEVVAEVSSVMIPLPITMGAQVIGSRSI
jgi:hypothetical protein